MLSENVCGLGKLQEAQTCYILFTSIINVDTATSKCSQPNCENEHFTFENFSNIYS